MLHCELKFDISLIVCQIKSSSNSVQSVEARSQNEMSAILQSTKISKLLNFSCSNCLTIGRIVSQSFAREPFEPSALLGCIVVSFPSDKFNDADREIICPVITGCVQAKRCVFLPESCSGQRILDNFQRTIEILGSGFFCTSLKLTTILTVEF